ncbi:MAG: PQQ-binding-like beta-propeller repeat protein [Verrucomicrobia bacterium]|nr:PQQ-binding-like beta-propeller repeat protein [Verrucomicrobiota bacterium]
MLRLPFFSGFLIVALALALPAHAADGNWPQWRGANRDDHSTDTGLLKEWPAGGPPLAWKITGLGPGYAGVSVAAGRIYTMGDGPGSSYLFALNEPDGRLLWKAKVGQPGGGGGYEGPRCTPTVDGELIFALGQFGDLVCVDTASGTVEWHKNLETDFGGKMMSGWGYAESPLVDGDHVICTPGGPQGTIVALDKKTGAVAWRTKDFTDNAAYCSLIIAEIGGVRQYIQLTDASVAGVAAADGKLLWRAPRVGRTAVIPTPIFHDNQVYVSSGYGVGCNLFGISANGGPFKAEPVYANKVMSNHHGGVVLVGDDLYGYSDGKGWVCQEFKTGKMTWSEREKLGKGSLTFADGHFYLRSEGGPGTVALIVATPAGYQEKGRFDQPDRSDKNSWPHPVVTGGRLYLRDQDVLLCYDVRQR